MVKLRAIRNHDYASRPRRAGKPYSAAPEHARYLVSAGLAEYEDIPSDPTATSPIRSRPTAPPSPDDSPVSAGVEEILASDPDPESFPDKPDPKEHLVAFKVEAKPRKSKRSKRTYRRRDMEADKE